MTTEEGVATTTDTVEVTEDGEVDSFVVSSETIDENSIELLNILFSSLDISDHHVSKLEQGLRVVISQLDKSNTTAAKEIVEALIKHFETHGGGSADYQHLIAELTELLSSIDS